MTPTTRISYKKSEPSSNKKKKFIPKTSKAQLADIEEIEKLSSVFGMPSKDIQKLINSDKTDSAISYFQNQMFKALVNLIPKAEAAYTKDPKQSNAYALNVLIETSRKLVQDIRATSDRNSVAKQVVNELMLPSFRTCIQDMIAEHFLLKSKLKSLVSSKDRRLLESSVDDCARVVAEKMSIIGKNLADNVSKAISE